MALNESSSASTARDMLITLAWCAPPRSSFSSAAANRPKACIGWRRSWLAAPRKTRLLVVGGFDQRHLLAQLRDELVVLLAHAPGAQHEATHAPGQAEDDDDADGQHPRRVAALL